ncbi:MAG: hypothetical protein QXQ77_00340 [Candidatus Aenigmatarchaeota archaeon]
MTKKFIYYLIVIGKKILSNYLKRKISKCFSFRPSNIKLGCLNRGDYEITAEFKIKNKLVKINESERKLIEDAIRDVIKEYGISLPKVTGSGVYLELPGRNEKIPNPGIFAFYDGSKIVLNFNNPLIRILKEIIEKAPSEGKKLSILSSLLTILAHEKTHEEIHEHNLQFYRGVEEEQLKMLERIINSISKKYLDNS